MDKAQEVWEVLRKVKEIVLPIFVSHALSNEIICEHPEIKRTVSALQKDWTEFQSLVQNIEADPAAQTSRMLVSARNSHTFSLEAMQRCGALHELQERVINGLRSLGSTLVRRIEEIENLNFWEEFDAFSDIYKKICDYSFSILMVDASTVSPSLQKPLLEADFRIYRHIVECDEITGKKTEAEKKWIKPAAYPWLKQLFGNCLFSIQEYLSTYRFVFMCITEQKRILEKIKKQHQNRCDLLASLNREFAKGSQLDAYVVEYKSLSSEDKICYHEQAIRRRRQSIEFVVREHKRTLSEINTLNWTVGKDAKNIANIKQSDDRKETISVKRLFFLFEDIEGSLKKIEHSLISYNKMASGTKKTAICEAKLFSTKALDFRYKWIEGDLTSLGEDLKLLYNASHLIYKNYLNRE